jgi:hypothetical protein
MRGVSISLNKPYTVKGLLRLERHAYKSRFNDKFPLSSKEG